MQITLNFEHFPENLARLIYFTVSYSINASDEEVFVSHSVWYYIVQAEIGQFIELLFENNSVDIDAILI